MKYEVYNLNGKQEKEMELDPRVFEVPLNSDLLHQVAVILQSNERQAVAHTKTRAEVRGGGRKPWKQKGTGRARAGSLRSPIFRGGGIIFGPSSDRNFKKKINKKMKVKAFVMSLSGKARDKELRIIDSFTMESPKTKTVSALVCSMSAFGKSILFVTAKKNANLEKSLGNIGRVQYKAAPDISTLDLLKNKFIFLDKEAVAYYGDKYHDAVKVTKDK